jgi:hypothetical protein
MALQLSSHRSSLIGQELTAMESAAAAGLCNPWCVLGEGLCNPWCVGRGSEVMASDKLTAEGTQQRARKTLYRSQ